VSRPFYDLSQRLARDFESSRRLRVHTECNHEESVLIYPYFESTLLSLIQDDPEFPAGGRMKVLRQVGEAIQELHNRDWIHISSFLLLEGHRMIVFRVDYILWQM
jgi:tRNA A-37 threonylcarbamoyl transferase component Bud32